jgi:RNA polymerase sigma-70 factor (ECF subfamily)
LPTEQPTTCTFLERSVNGQPGMVAHQGGVTVTVFAFDVVGDLIKHIWVVRNPEKLRPWTSGLSR